MNRASGPNSPRRQLPGGRQCERERRRRPAGGQDRDELILAMWVAGFVVRLDRRAPRRHVPRAVVQLPGEEETQPVAISGVSSRDSASLVERDERGAGGVSIAVQAGELRPTAVRSLRLEKVLRRAANFILGGLRDAQRSKAEHAILRFLRRCVQRPLPNLPGALRDAYLLPGRAKHFQAAQRDVADREETFFTGRPDGLRLLMIEVVLKLQEGPGHRVGRLIGFPTAHFKRPERVARR